MSWGLRGGVDWGFESQNILEETRELDSTSAAMVGVSFSALGGSGLVNAGFARDKTRITADAFLGRTFFTSIERIGRIGVLWNVAKHIIVYERSTRASEQFPDEHEKWKGRAVLRKVREVVQITEGVRAFPDALSDGKATSFVRGSRFQLEPIEVDSRWGRDVPDGWEVPLHQPNARSEPPRVFLEFASMADDGAGKVAARILNPDDLYFFTSTRRADGADTDAWPAFAGVDFPSGDIPVRDSLPGAAPASDPLPDAAATEAGLERFTFRVDTSGLRTNLGKHRTTTPFGGVVENVTLARRAARNYDPADPRFNLDKYPDLPNDVRETIANIRVTLERGASTNDALDIVENAHAALFADSQAFNSRIATFVAEAKRARDMLRAHQEDATLAFKRLQEFAVVPDPAAWIESSAKPWLRDAAKTDAKQDAVRIIIRSGLDRVRQVQNVARELVARWQRASAVLSAARERLDRELDRNARLLLENAGVPPEEWKRRCRAFVGDVVRLGAASRDELGSDLAGAFRTWSGALEAALAQLVALPPADRTAANIDEALSRLRAPLELAHDEINTALRGAESAFLEFDESLEALDEGLDEFAAELEAQLARAVDGAVLELAKWLEAQRGAVAKCCATAAARIGDFAETFKPLFDHLPSDAELESLGALAERLLDGTEPRALLEALLRTPLRALEARKAILASRLESYRRILHGDKRARDALEALDSVGERGLRALRAFGVAPEVPGLDFARKKVAYYFLQGAKQSVSAIEGIQFTPNTALIGRARDALQALGVQWPTGGFGAALLPDYKALASSLLRSIFPDFAGINLSDLLQGVMFPSSGSDGVKIGHGFDPATKQAWLDATIAVATSSAPLFDFAPIRMELREVKFDADARIYIDPDGNTRQRTRGSLTAHWCLVFAGTDVMVLRDTRADFSDGRLSFKVEPKNIELPGAVRFLVDALAAAAPSGDGGLGIELVHDGNSAIPVGIRAVLGLALPILGTPAVAISNLTLRSYLEVALLSEGFTIAVGLGLSSRERPFQLSVLLLSGGGWLDVSVRYTIGKQVVPRLSIGIAAGLNLPFNIGIASGGVSLLLDVGIEWTGGGAPLSIILGITLRGELQVLGLISVSLVLRLEAEYRTSGLLVARGRLRLKIKICWFIKIDVDVGFEIVLAGKKANKLLLAFDGAEDPIDLYLKTFGGVL